jgi:hypothetical protein
LHAKKDTKKEEEAKKQSKEDESVLNLLWSVVTHLKVFWTLSEEILKIV